jgi:hypothetical protein
MTNSRYDVFISHASPDKDAFARPLAQALHNLGLKVWYDEFSLELGDSISEQIDRGIASSRFGIVVLSPAFLDRKWPRHELRALANRNVEEDLRILPIWHGVDRKQVSDFSPSLADKVAIDTRKADAKEAAIRILRHVRPDLYNQHPRGELEGMVSGEAITDLQEEIDRLQEELKEYRCPHCGSALVGRVEAPMDEEERHWDVVDLFECGLRLVGGVVARPCPRDPLFPAFDDYEISFQRHQEGRRTWAAVAKGKTEMARKVALDIGYGTTKEEALGRLRSHYLYAARKISNKEWFQATL